MFHVRQSKLFARGCFVIGGTGIVTSLLLTLVMGTTGLAGLPASLAIMGIGAINTDRPVYSIDPKNNELIFKAPIGPAERRKKYQDLLNDEGKVFYIDPSGKKKKLSQNRFLYEKSDIDKIREFIRDKG